MLFFLLACGSKTDETNVCVQDFPEASMVNALINDEAWSSAIQWSAAGSGVQFTTTSQEGFRLTLVALQDSKGRAAADAIDESDGGAAAGPARVGQANVHVRADGRDGR